MTDEHAAELAAGHVLLPSSCLVVDDDPFDRRMVKRCFGRDRPEIHLLEADCIASARAVLTDIAPDVILLDHRLPDGQGAAFAAELRMDSRLKNAVICLVTSADPRLLDPSVTALSKDALTPRTLWAALESRHGESAVHEEIFVDPGSDAKETGTVFDAGAVGDLAPAVSRMLRTLRSAKSRSRLTAPRAAMDDLEKLEEMLLALSETVARH